MLQDWLRKLQIMRKKTFDPTSEEAALAYFYRLPDKIEVEWKKEGNFIVGWIKIEGEDVFMTQARSAKEFVEMVNDAIFSVYKIPVQYFKHLEEKKFKPNSHDFQLLNDKAVRKSVLDLKKQLVTA